MKIFIRILIGVVSLIVLFTLGIVIFMNTSPQFGQAPEGDRLSEIEKSPNYTEENFRI